MWRVVGGVVGLGSGLGVTYARRSGYRSRSEAEVKAHLPDVDEELDLLMVHLVCRHGARTPLHTLLAGSDFGTKWALCDVQRKDDLRAAVVLSGVNGDPPGHVYNHDATPTPLHGGCMPGELTELGCEQLNELGRKLRENYVENTKLISDTFNEDEVYIRASFQQRAVESAQALLNGLYPKEKRPAEIPLHVMEKTKESIIPNTGTCPRLKRLFSEARRAWHKNEELHEIRDHVSVVLEEDQRQPIIHFFDNFMGRHAHGLELPNGVSPNLLENVSRLAAWEIATFFDHPDALKLAIGPLWKEIHETQENTLNKSGSGHKLVVYSGHDTTLLPMLLTLDAFDGVWPKFSANITIELLKGKESGEPYVRVKYNHEPLNIPACDGKDLCKYSEFSKLLDRVKPEDKEKLCADDHATKDGAVATSFH